LLNLSRYNIYDWGTCSLPFNHKVWRAGFGRLPCKMPKKSGKWQKVTRFETKIALEGGKGEQTIVELARRSKVHQCQIVSNYESLRGGQNSVITGGQFLVAFSSTPAIMPRDACFSPAKSIIFSVRSWRPTKNVSRNPRAANCF